MALETLSNLGQGGAGYQGDGDGSAAKMIRELQGLKVVSAAGALNATNIAIAGIKTTDTLVSVIESAAGVLTDRTSEASITSAGNIQLSTTDTTGDSLLVVYFVKP